MKNKDWFLVILLGVFWGASFLFVEILLEYITPFLVVYLRVAIASALLLIYILIRDIKFQFSRGDHFNLLVMGLLNNVFPFLLIAYGQQSITGGLASILNANTSFITILLVALFIPNEKLNLHRTIGVLIGILGVILAVDYQNIFQLNNDSVGQYLILLATISYSFAGIWAKLKLQNLPPVVSAAGMLTMSTIFLSPYILSTHFEELSSLNFDTLKYALGFALICTVFAYFIYFKILESTGAGNLLICTIIIPPSSIILNSIFIGEVINTNEILGLLVIIVGLLVIDGRILGKKFV
jgi:drug/metabolite transporter (DMT)-like permease